MANYNYPLYPTISFDPAKNKIYALAFDFDIPPLATKQLLIRVDDAFMRLIEQKMYMLNGEIDLKVLEDVTFSDPGTPLVTGCIDRNITAPSKVDAYLDPVGVTGGDDTLGLAHFGMASDVVNTEMLPPQLISAVTMKRMTDYVYSFTNPSSTEAVTNANFLMVWVE